MSERKSNTPCYINLIKADLLYTFEMQLETQTAYLMPCFKKKKFSISCKLIVRLISVLQQLKTKQSLIAPHSFFCKCNILNEFSL